MKKVLIATLLAAAMTCTGAQAQEGKAIRIVQYNVGAFHKSAKSTPKYVARMMKEAKADVVSLNEVDSCNIRSAGKNQLNRFCKAMGGWKGHFANALSFGGGGYGVAVASKPSLAIVNEYSIHLEKGEGSEPRAAAVMEYEDFVLASTHLDFRDEQTNMAQAMVLSWQLRRRYEGIGKPVFLCGDLNATPDSRTVTFLKQDWTLLSPSEPTFPSWAPEKCIDFVFVLGHEPPCKVTKSEVIRNFSCGKVVKASDHQPVLVEIVLQ